MCYLMLNFSDDSCDNSSAVRSHSMVLFRYEAVEQNYNLCNIQKKYTKQGGNKISYTTFRVVPHEISSEMQVGYCVYLSRCYTEV
jgi:hypothetical protein